MATSTGRPASFMPDSGRNDAVAGFPAAGRAVFRKSYPAIRQFGVGLNLDADFHFHIRRRNCDAAVERSSALEAFDEVAALRLGNAGQLKPEVNEVEDREVAAHRIRAVDGALDLDADPRRRELTLPRDHLHELDAASGDARQEKLRGRDGLAGAAVLDRAINDEMLVACVALHAPKRVRRARVYRVAATSALCHVSSADVQRNFAALPRPALSAIEPGGSFRLLQPLRLHRRAFAALCIDDSGGGGRGMSAVERWRRIVCQQALYRMRRLGPEQFTGDGEPEIDARGDAAARNPVSIDHNALLARRRAEDRQQVERAPVRG